jgi:glutamate carboxypeptidase
VNRLGELIADRFARFRFQPSFIPSTRADYGRHLVLETPRISGAPTVAFVSHLDTVFTEEEEERNAFRWRPDGSRIYGPGTNDIKGGTALIHLVLSALQATSPALFSRTNWVVLLNACEEVISADFRNVCRSRLPATTRACLVFEADGGEQERYSLVEARKGRATFCIEVEGRGAHAGSQHRRGANAVVQLARIITQIDRLTCYDEELTVNIGSFQGGTVANRVPHFARALFEMRAFAPEVYERAKASILAWQGEGDVRSADDDAHACRVSVSLTDETPPWPRNPATARLMTLWRETGRELGLEVATEERGGLSDGNVLWDLFPTLDGLGPRGDNSHCSEQSVDGRKQQEWVDVTSFVPKAVLNACAITTLLEQPSPSDAPAGHNRRGFQAPDRA